MNEEDKNILGAFLLAKHIEELTTEEIKDVQQAIKNVWNNIDKTIKYINNISPIICRYYDYDEHKRCYPYSSYVKVKEDVEKNGLEGHFVEVNKDKISKLLNGGDKE